MPQSSSDLTFRHTRSEYAHNLLYIKDGPLNMDDYPMFRAIYDGDYHDMVLKTSRQVGKSTTLAAFGIVESMCRPQFQSIFVTPTAEQTSRFSVLKVAKIIQFSPFIRDHYMGDKEANRVLLRMFTNGSELAFTYAQEDADRARGLSADRVCLDECQDMLLEAVEPVVVSCMENSKYQYLMRCGTPKTMENPIETAWQDSSMSEWIIPCHKCNKWNAIRSEEYFSPTGPICIKCKNLINPREGKWLDFRTDVKMRRKGFHISRANMPEAVPICWKEGTPEREEAEKRWANVWDKLSGPSPWPISQFRNEVIGVSDSIGRRIITLEHLRSLCRGPKCERVLNVQGNCKNVGRLAAGIDWSGGGSEYKSRTVLAIVGLTVQRKLRLVYYKIFPGTSPVEEVEEIAATLQQFSAHMAMVGCDAGEGNMPTDMLRRKFDPNKITKFRYCASDYYCRWKETYMSVNRTRAIDSLLMSLNRGEWEFPADDPMTEVIFSDILNEFEEVTREGNKVWRHAPTRPDDALHALNFARLAMQRAIGELDLTS